MNVAVSSRAIWGEAVPTAGDDFGELVTRIYDAAIDSTLWPAVLAEARDYVGGMAANLYAKRGWRLTGGLYHDDGGITDYYKQIYTERFVTLDPATPAELNAEIESPVSTIDCAELDEYRQTRFYQEWQMPQGMVDFICAPIEKTAERTSLFCIFRHERDGMADDAALMRMRRLVPHIRRAALVSQMVEQAASKARAFSEVLDGLSAGLFFVDSRNNILHSNVAGDGMLDEGRAVASRQGRLATVSGAATRALADAAEAAGNGDAALDVKAISVPIEARDGGHFAAHVLPLTAGSRRGSVDGFAASAAVFIRPATLNTPTAAQLVARAFGLTPSEQRALARIVEIGGVPDTAEALGIGEATLKTHLHRIFAKTGTQRQADLVKLLAAYSSPLEN